MDDRLTEAKEIIRPIIKNYFSSFSAKTYNDENEDYDFLMELFGVTPEQKRENRQYWGRELGMCWQLILTELAKKYSPEFKPALRFDRDEPCDLIIGNDAIDTKYRIGSGDSGTLKKFKQYGQAIKDMGYNPVILIVREDNLHAAISACHTGGWKVYTGNATLKYVQDKIGIDLLSLILNFHDEYDISK